jgi:hypothetical protein
MTGTTIGTTIVVPSEMDVLVMEAIIAAPVDEANIFDIILDIDVWEADVEGVQGWRTRDRNHVQRDLDTGAIEPVFHTVYTRLERVAGKSVRACLSCGQSLLAVSCILTTTG